MDVVDARKAFYKRNEYCLKRVMSQHAQTQQMCLSLIPLIFHLNTRQLPGYIGPDVPAGIYGYGASDKEILIAKKFSNKFVYESELPLKNVPIESIFIQFSEINNEYKLWVIHAEGLRSAQIELLDHKALRVKQWLNNHDMPFNIYVTTASNVSIDVIRDKSERYYAAPGLFLDEFYTETILVAGKYPLWWLVPLNDEYNYEVGAKKIRDARFVVETEYVDIGGVNQLTRKEILLQSIFYAQQSQSSLLKSWFNLLLMSVRLTGFSEMRGMAWHVKNKLYNSESADNYSVDLIRAEVVREAVSLFKSKDDEDKVYKLIKELVQYSPMSERVCLSKIFDTEQSNPDSRRDNVDVEKYVKSYLELMAYIYTTFKNIHEMYDQYESTMNDVDLLRQVHDVYDYIGESMQRIPVYNPNAYAGILQARVLLRHEVRPVNHWLFVINDHNGQEKIVFSSPSLLAVMAWAWINHLIDHSTQLSVECPMRLIRQIEARYILEVLIAHLDRNAVFNINRLDFIKPRRPKYAFVFINHDMDEQTRKRIESLDENMDSLSFGDITQNLVGQCEQLVISNWGDVKVHRYSGDIGVLSCLGDWVTFAFGSVKPKALPFKAFGYAAGSSTYLAQRMEEVYGEMMEFYGRKKKLLGRFVLRLGSEYYALEANNSGLRHIRLGNESALMHYLEQPVAQFMMTGIDRLAMLAMPLREIYQRNKENIIQVFYKVQNRQCDTWVLDEKGSLCYFKQNWYGNDRYISRLLYLLRNIRGRMKKINYQNRELPAIEISHIYTARVGVIEFNKILPDSISPDRDFIELAITVESNGVGGKITIECGNKRFGYEEYGDDVISECVQYINARIMGEGRRPVYITDIDVPLKYFNVDDRENVQTIHYFKYIRNLEQRINHMIGE